MSWINEFGPAYQVPSEVLLTQDVFDSSWHNDVCPSFCLPGCDGRLDGCNVRLWVEHPDPAMRECGPKGARFSVSDCDSGDEFYHGDDIAEAIRVWHVESARVVAIASKVEDQ